MKELGLKATFVFLLATVLLFVACGDDDDNDDDDLAVDDDDQVGDDDVSPADDDDAVTDDDDNDDNDDASPDDDDDNDDATPLDDDDNNDDDDNDDDDATPYPPDYCAYFLTGEVDLTGTDADQDGSPNGWDHCPNNSASWQDSDRDGIGNGYDPDLDGDGLANEEDPDRDGDGVDDLTEETAGSDPADPTSLPGLPRFDLDLGIWNPSPGWYLGELHLHTEYSHDSAARLVWYLAAYEDSGLDFLAITDHDVFEAPFDPAWNQNQLLLIPGIEWGGAGGHANMWGLRTLIDAASNEPDDIRQSWRLNKLQGGVQSLNHYGADAEDWDALFTIAPDLLAELDVIEVWNIYWMFNWQTNQPSIDLWEELLNQGYRIGAVSGGDAHYSPLVTLGPTNVVWAESLSVPGILDGIRRGRSYITQGEFFSFAGRPSLDFRIDADDDGLFEAMLGDEVSPGLITLRIDIRNARGIIRLIRNGNEIAAFTSHEPGDDVVYEFQDDAPAGAWYRVEMRDKESRSSAMRLFSSAIYVAGEK